jgi:hypothetical protein
MDKRRSKGLFRTVSIALLVVLAVALMPKLNQECTKYLDNWTKKSIVTFALAAGINSGLSVIEDTELEVGIGLGASIALGDIVRPLNDMVARVATVALASAVSLGIQRILMGVGASSVFKWLLMLSILGLLVTEWIDWPALRRLASWLLVLALVASFAIPVAVYATGIIGDQFTKGAYAEAQQQFQKLNTEVKRLDPKDISRLGDRLKSTAAAYTEFAVTYIVVLIFQTMLMPILLLWGLIKLPGLVFGTAAAAGMEARLMAAIRGASVPNGSSS